MLLKTLSDYRAVGLAIGSPILTSQSTSIKINNIKFDNNQRILFFKRGDNLIYSAKSEGHAV